MVGIHVPGIGYVPIRIRRTVEVRNADGTGCLRVFIEPVFPPSPGGGEPLPIAEAA